MNKEELIGLHHTQCIDFVERLDDKFKYSDNIKWLNKYMEGRN